MKGGPFEDIGKLWEKREIFEQCLRAKNLKMGTFWAFLMSTKGSPLSIFFRHCATIFDFFCLQRVPPSSFFDVLQQTGFFKSPKGPPLTVLKNLRFLDIAPTLDVPVLFNMTKPLS